MGYILLAYHNGFLYSSNIFFVYNNNEWDRVYFLSFSHNFQLLSCDEWCFHDDQGIVVGETIWRTVTDKVSCYNYLGIELLKARPPVLPPSTCYITFKIVAAISVVRCSFLTFADKKVETKFICPFLSWNGVSSHKKHKYIYGDENYDLFLSSITHPMMMPREHFSKVLVWHYHKDINYNFTHTRPYTVS